MSQIYQRRWRKYGARAAFAVALSAIVFGCGESGTESDVETSSSEPALLEDTSALDPTVPSEPELEDPVARGERLFAACVACHSAYDPESDEIPPNLLGGPDLWGVFDRAAGAVSGFRYSRALSEGDIVWTADNLDAFLESPQRFAPGNSMAYFGMRDETDRADMIAYLATLRS